LVAVALGVPGLGGAGLGGAGLGIRAAHAEPSPALSCTDLGYPGAPACRDYVGNGWDATSASTDCANVPGTAPGTLQVGVSCPSDGILGTCTVDGGTPSESRLHFYGGDLAMAESACVNFLAGSWSDGGGGGPSGGLDPAVVAALGSDAEVTVTPADCLDEACLGALVAAGAALEFTPTGGAPTRGLILYPGAMVDPRAYAVAARALAARGFFVAVVPFAGNLPITDPMRANGVLLAHPEIARWAIGGHSLGGVAASIYAAADPFGLIEGLALWASYPPPGVDLSGGALKVVDITATLDGVLDWPAWTAAQTQLPADTLRSASLRGGNHAQFGYYGEQAGDHDAAISREHQHALVVGATAHLLNRLGLPAAADVESPYYTQSPPADEGFCVRAQRRLAGFPYGRLKPSDIANETHPLESDFVRSKPGFPAEGAVVAVTTHVHQIPNPDDPAAPPVLDGEVWCKMKNQPALAERLGSEPLWEEGQCADVNRAVLARALWSLEPWEVLLLVLQGVLVRFDEDGDTYSGPQWLGVDVTIDRLDAAEYAVQSPRLWTPTTVPAPYGGNYYCKVWSRHAARQLLSSHLP
jgi:hypothetical protein